MCPWWGCVIKMRARMCTTETNQGLPDNSGGSAQWSIMGTTKTNQGLPDNSGGNAQQSSMGTTETNQVLPGCSRGNAQKAPWSKQRPTNLALCFVFRGLELRAGGSPFRPGLSCFNLLAPLLGSVALATAEEVAFLLAPTSTSMALAWNLLLVITAYKGHLWLGVPFGLPSPRRTWLVLVCPCTLPANQFHPTILCTCHHYPLSFPAPSVRGWWHVYLCVLCMHTCKHKCTRNGKHEKREII